MLPKLLLTATAKTTANDADVGIATVAAAVWILRIGNPTGDLPVNLLAVGSHVPTLDHFLVELHHFWELRVSFGDYTAECVGHGLVGVGCLMLCFYRYLRLHIELLF